MDFIGNGFSSEYMFEGTVELFYSVQLMKLLCDIPRIWVQLGSLNFSDKFSCHFFIVMLVRNLLTLCQTSYLAFLMVLWFR